MAEQAVRRMQPDEFLAWRPEGLDAIIELEELEISLPLGVFYQGVQFRPRPRLVQPE